jgi:predicted nucleotidyltransferase component of viral defense system
MSEEPSPKIEQTDLVVNLEGWISKKRSDPLAYLERQATEVLLSALGSSPFEGRVYLKGGVLMGILYDSPRQTGDVDFTTTMSPRELNKEKFQNQLDTNMRYAATKLGYPDLVMKVQSIREQPHPKFFENASFPALKFKVGYAKRGTPQERQVENGTGVIVLEADISFNEPVDQIQVVRVAETGSKIYAYSLIDLLAEKIRAFLQQEVRGRSRRQDIYDLAMLIERFPLDGEEMIRLHEVLITKCRSREIEPTRGSIRQPELIERAQAEWNTLAQEIGEDPPPFEERYEVVRSLYERLPWSTEGSAANS